MNAVLSSSLGNDLARAVIRRIFAGSASLLLASASHHHLTAQVQCTNLPETISFFS
jgi:pyrroline-5-carboxylate reductase